MTEQDQNLADAIAERLRTDLPFSLLPWTGTIARIAASAAQEFYVGRAVAQLHRYQKNA